MVDVEVGQLVPRLLALSTTVSQEQERQER
jgi:hypothetical protein